MSRIQECERTARAADKVVLNRATKGLPRLNMVDAQTKTARKQYRNPPITEAVIELRFDVPQPVDFAAVKRVAESDLKDMGFSEVSELKGMRAEFKLGGDIPPPAYFQEGFRLQNLEDGYIALLKQSAMTFSKLEPYHAWEDLCDAALQAWSHFRKVLPDGAGFTRFGIRYVNKIQISKRPDGKYDIDDFVNIGPKWDEDTLGPDINHCDLTIGWSFKEQKCSVKTRVLATGDELLVDIDVFRTDALPEINDDLIPLLTQMKEIEARVFESSITDRSRELFQ